MGAWECQEDSLEALALQPQQSSCVTRPLRFSAAAVRGAAPLDSFVPLRSQHCCLQFASATYGSSSPYANSTSRIEASSPSCQIVSCPHRDVQNMGPDTTLFPSTNTQAQCKFRTATGAQEAILHLVHCYSLPRRRSFSSTAVSRRSVEESGVVVESGVSMSPVGCRLALLQNQATRPWGGECPSFPSHPPTQRGGSSASS